MSETMGLLEERDRMRCDQCKHWKVSDEWETNRVGFRECAAVRQRWDIEAEAAKDVAYPGGPHLKWRTDEDGNDVTDDAAYNGYIKSQVEAVQREMAYVQDGSEYRAELYTGPDFFCAKFSALALSKGSDV